MMRLVFVIALAALAFARGADAQNIERPIVHVVRDGETLASIAERYYGDARREKVLVMDNGLHIEGGTSIVIGMRLHIPSVTYHRVVQGETWNALALRYFGEARRAAELMSVNHASPGAPDPGAVIVVPYPLRHIVTQSEDILDIARLYYDDPERGAMLRRFNGFRGSRLERGQVVLVPLETLTLREDERGAVADTDSAESRRLLDEQRRIESELPTLRDHVRRGRYLEAVGLAHRWMGGRTLPESVRIAVLRELATAYVALDRRDLAEQTFREVLSLNAGFTMDERRTSPRVLEALTAARSAE